jgi:uncharacterized membrane protein YfcA
MTHLAIFLVAFASWSVNTLTSGGGSLLLLAALTYVIPIQDVVPVISLASLVAGIGRFAMSWRSIAWPVTAWYTPGAVLGAIFGTWLFPRLDPVLLQVLAGCFLVGAAWQYRRGRPEQILTMRLCWFVPVSFVVGAVSAVVGASGVIALPFYMKYGLVKEPMLATRAANSLLLQVAKLSGYAAFGVLRPEILHDGAIAGAATVAAILTMTPLVRRMPPERFRLLAAAMMFVTGSTMLWRHRGWIAAGIGAW